MRVPSAARKSNQSILKEISPDISLEGIVTFIFMVAAVMFMVIGSTLLYSLFGGAEKTYEKCNSSDVYCIMDQDVADEKGLIESFTKDLEEKQIITDYVYVRRLLDGITDSMQVEFGQALGDGEWQGSLVCCSPWSCRVRHD